MNQNRSMMFSDVFYVVALLDTDKRSLLPLQICGSILTAIKWIEQPLLTISEFISSRKEKDSQIVSSTLSMRQSRSYCFHLLRLRYNEWVIGLEKSVGYFLREDERKLSFIPYIDLEIEQKQNSAFLFPPQLYLEIEQNNLSISHLIHSSPEIQFKRWRVVTSPNYLNLLFPIIVSNLICEFPKIFGNLLAEKSRKSSISMDSKLPGQGENSRKSSISMDSKFPEQGDNSFKILESKKLSMAADWSLPGSQNVKRLTESNQSGGVGGVGNKRPKLQRTKRLENLLDLFK